MRRHYLDNIKWIVQIIVVLYHVFFMYNGIGLPGVFGQITKEQFVPGDMFQYMVYPWFMTLLFIAAGISARLFLGTHSAKEFLKRRTVRLLVPSTIGVLVFGYVQGYLNMALSKAFGSTSQLPVVLQFLIMCISGTGVLWFLQVLWVCSVILVLVIKIEKGRLLNICSKFNVIALILLVIPFFGAGLILNTPIIACYRFGLYIMAFMSGYFIFSHEEVMARIKKALPLFVVCAAASGIAFCVLHFGENYADAPANRTAEYLFFAYFMSVTLLALAAKYLDFATPVTTWIYKRSFGLYVFHYIGISLAALFVAGRFDLHPALIYIMSAAAGFGVGFLLNAIISRIPFFRWAVLGISKRKGKKDVQG